MLNWLQHNGNPLHIYCKLRRLGFPKSIAKKVCCVIEKFIKPLIYRKERSYVRL